MKKILALCIVTLNLFSVGCSYERAEPYYVDNGKIYKCIILDGDIATDLISYVSDKETIVKRVYDSDVYWFKPSEVSHLTE